MGQLFQIFIDNIAPILLIAALGYIVAKRKAVDPRPVGRVIFYIFSPGLIFDSLSKTNVEASELGLIAFIVILFAGTMYAIASVVAAWRCPTNRLERAGVILSAIAPNNGNFGLPLLGFAFNDDVFARGVVVYIVMALLNYTLGIFVASRGSHSWRDAAGNVLRVPVVYAAGAGLLVNALDVTLPPALARSVGLVAQAAVPAMIVLLGLQLAQVSSLAEIRLVSLGVGLRLLASPLIALALVMLFHVGAESAVAIIVQASMPVAVVTIIFATEFGLDDKLMSSTILTSTLVSPITLSVLILILRQTLLPPTP